MDCQVGDATFHFETCGEGRPLLALHGWGGDAHAMAADFEPLFVARPGWKRIYVDLPGRGRTAPSMSLANEDAILDAVLTFVDKVIPGERFAVAGTSYGGYLARGILHQRANQLDGLCLVVPAIYNGDLVAEVPPPVTLVSDPGLRATLLTDMPWVFDAMVVQEASVVEAINTNLVPAIEHMDNDFLDEASKPENSSFSFSVDSLPAPFYGPSLFLMGRQDSMVGYRDAWRILEHYPRATFAVLDRAGHLAPYEQPMLFQALVGEWLDRVEEFAKA